MLLPAVCQAVAVLARDISLTFRSHSPPSSPDFLSSTSTNCSEPALMATLRTFTGTEDVNIWLSDFDVFCELFAPNAADDQKLQIAQARLSTEIRQCYYAVAAKVQQMLGHPWPRTWPKLKSILISISGTL